MLSTQACSVRRACGRLRKRPVQRTNRVVRTCRSLLGAVKKSGGEVAHVDQLCRLLGRVQDEHWPVLARDAIAGTPSVVPRAADQSRPRDGAGQPDVLAVPWIRVSALWMSTSVGATIGVLGDQGGRHR